MTPPDGPAWVFHRGALGDSVLLWPMLRAWRAAGIEVTLITDRSKAELAAEELGIRAEDAEQPRFNQLWVPRSSCSDPIRGVRTVTAFVGPTTAWLENAAHLFPDATVNTIPDRPTRPLSLPYPHPPPRFNPRGPIILHIGAGSESKRWLLSSWLRLTQQLSGIAPVHLIAGDVEHERLTAADLVAFHERGGQVLWSLTDLAATVKTAALFISADSGPAHLAAQLGIPTLTLFGPTDPALWAPVGPLTRILAPVESCPMEWLQPNRVHDAARDFLAAVYG